MKFRPITGGQLPLLFDGWDDRAAAAAERAWGGCGIAAVDSDRICGYSLVCPATHVPRDSPQSGGPVTQASAALLFLDVVAADSWNDPLARDVLRHTLAWLARRYASGLEAFGSPGAGAADLPPTSWLEEQGFDLVRADPIRPKYRIALARTLPVRTAVSRAWRGLLTPAKLPGKPEPASRTDQPLST